MNCRSNWGGLTKFFLSMFTGLTNVNQNIYIFIQEQKGLPARSVVLQRWRTANYFFGSKKCVTSRMTVNSSTRFLLMISGNRKNPLLTGILDILVNSLNFCYGIFCWDCYYWSCCWIRCPAICCCCLLHHHVLSGLLSNIFILTCFSEVRWLLDSSWIDNFAD